MLIYMEKEDIYIAARFLTQPITGVQRYGIGLSKAIKKLQFYYGLFYITPAGNYAFLPYKGYISEFIKNL